MHTIRMLAVAAVLAAAACTDEAAPAADEAVTGTWAGNFTTDNVAVQMGTFTFALSEDAGHNISGTFTGTAGSQNLAGTVSAKRTSDRLQGTIMVTAPLALNLTFPDAAIADDTITGMFTITAPIMAKGSFNITRR